MPEEIEKLEYMYQHFQDHERVYETDPHITTEHTDNTLYPQINNDIEYGLFENVIDSYYLDSQIRDDFQCTKTCYRHDTTAGMSHSHPPCTHTYDHISQQLSSLADTEQQQTLHTNEADTSLFTTDTSTPCAFNITPSDLETESQHDVYDHSHFNTGIIFIVNIDIDILEKHMYSIMILIMVMHSFIKPSTQHCYNKSYKIPIGVYMIQSQPKAIRYLLTRTLKPCLMPCISLAIQIQLLKLTMSHTKPYSMMIKVCSKLN